MADSGENAQFLEESLSYYKERRPPFVRTGRSKPNITVQLVDTGEVQVVNYKNYPTSIGLFIYGTIRIEGHIFIVRPLPKDWKRGDTTDVNGGCKDWFVWQGLDHKFCGPLFNGPVARSAGPVVKNEREAKKAKLQRTQAAPRPDTSPSQRPDGPSRKAQFTYKRDSSPPFLESSPDPDLCIKLEDATHARPPRSLSSADNVLNQDTSHRNPYSEAVELTCLTLRQENATNLRIKIFKDPETYFPLHLSSARPRTDPEGAVTNESLFEEITNIANTFKPSTGEIHALEAKFKIDRLNRNGDLDDTRDDWLDMDPFMIVRWEEDTFECFQSHILAFDKLDDKVSWHVVLRVNAE